MTTPEANQVSSPDAAASAQPFRPTARVTLVGRADAADEGPQAALRELAGWLGYGLTERTDGGSESGVEQASSATQGSGSAVPEPCFVCPCGGPGGEPLEAERSWVDWALSCEFQPVVLVGPPGVCAALLAGRRSQRLRVVVYSPEEQPSVRLFALRCFAEVLLPVAPSSAAQLPWVEQLHKPMLRPEPRAARFRRSAAAAASRLTRALESHAAPAALEHSLGWLGRDRPPALPNRATQQEPSLLVAELGESQSWAAFDKLEELDLTQFEVT